MTTAKVKIILKDSKAELEFDTLDSALRQLNGITEGGDRFGKPLLTTPSRRTFKEAFGLLDRNGYELGKHSPVTQAPREVKVEEPKKEEPKVEKSGKIQHFQFKTLLAAIAARVNVMLVGPAGSGKTSGAHEVSKTLGLPFFSISVGMQTTKTEFFGYMDATGKYVRTLFREAFEKGGVFLLDEMDAGNANVITSINQALANSYCAFPDGMVNKHPDFVIVSSANTFGTGANREYVGRNQLDAATLDRFAVIEWGYDNALEDSLCDNKVWLAYVRKCRANAETHKVRTVISPRASILGAQLLAQGLKEKDVQEMLIFKGMNATERGKLIGA